MDLVSESRKTESGAELLARLHTRPNLQSVDSFIFRDSLSSSSKSLSSCGGQLIEVNGPEGVGKTEFALHCAARACLPVSSQGVELYGLGSKVIYVDTHFKFSILRFSVILEKLIQHALQIRRSKIYNKDSFNKEEKNEGILEGSTAGIVSNSASTTKLPDGASTIKLPEGEEQQSIRFQQQDYPDLSNEDIEAIIQESLERIFVLKVSNSLQLVASLMSLEKSISEDHLYSLLIIDKVSTFYWIDKSAEANGGSLCKENSMVYVSKAVSKMVNQFGLTCLSLSATLFSGPKKGHAFHQGECGGGKAKSEDIKNFFMKSEYLGKSWVSVRTKKIVFTKSELDLAVMLNDNKNTSKMDERPDQTVRRCKVISALCSSTNTEKRFVFKDNIMMPL